MSFDRSRDDPELDELELDLELELELLELWDESLELEELERFRFLLSGDRFRPRSGLFDRRPLTVELFFLSSSELLELLLELLRPGILRVKS